MKQVHEELCREIIRKEEQLINLQALSNYLQVVFNHLPHTTGDRDHQRHYPETYNSINNKINIIQNHTSILERELAFNQSKNGHNKTIITQKNAAINRLTQEVTNSDSAINELNIKIDRIQVHQSKADQYKT